MDIGLAVRRGLSTCPQQTELVERISVSDQTHASGTTGARTTRKG